MISSHRKGILAAILTGLVWSVLSLSLKSALTFADPASISWIRLFAGSLILATYFAFKEKTFFSDIKALPWYILIAGLGLAGNFLGFVIGIGLTGAGHATVLIQLGTLLLSVASLLVFKDRLGPLQKVGVVTAILGFVLFHYAKIRYVENASEFKVGDAWLIGGAITWTVWALLHKKISLTGINPQKINAVVFFIASLAILPLAKPMIFLDLHFQQWLHVGFLILNSVIGYGSLAYAMEKAPVYQVSLIVALYPLLTLLLTQATEPLDFLGFIGGVFVVTGIALATRKK